MSAEPRLEEIVGIAFRQFAEGGYDGTPTEAIAREAGLSEPDLLRRVGSRRELFEACTDRCFEQMQRLFEATVSGTTPAERLLSMGDAYADRLAADRHALLFQMRGYAVADPELRAYVRERLLGLRARVAELAGVAPDDTWEFFASGMLLNVLAMLDVEW